MAQMRQEVHFFINYNTGFSYRIIEGNSSFKTTLNDLEEPLLVHGGDILTDIPLGRKIGLITGLGFVSYGDKVSIEHLSFRYPDPIDPYYGFVYESNEQSVDLNLTIRYYHNYVNLPVLLRFNLTSNRQSSLNATAGLNANFYLYSKQRTTQRFESGGVRRYDNDIDIPARKIIPGTTVALVYSRYLRNDVIIQFGPRFDMLLMGMYNSSEFSRLPYRVGFSLGAGI